MSLSLACLAQACGFQEQAKTRKSKPELNERRDIRVDFQVLLVPGFSPALAQLPALMHAGVRRN